MPSLAIAETFLDALGDLDRTDAKRAAAFVDKLLRAPEAASLKPEIVHDAADRSVRSFRVTQDLRAIAHLEGDRVLLLFVARHDRAYAWARDRCIECHPVTGKLYLVSTAAGTRATDAGGVPLTMHACVSTEQLCQLLNAAGIEHDLAF
jgi:hypothetical protein